VKSRGADAIKREAIPHVLGRVLALLAAGEKFEELAAVVVEETDGRTVFIVRTRSEAVATLREQTPTAASPTIPYISAPAVDGKMIFVIRTLDGVWQHQHLPRLYCRAN
jgi:hypothetical protein